MHQWVPLACSLTYLVFVLLGKSVSQGNKKMLEKFCKDSRKGILIIFRFMLSDSREGVEKYGQL